MTKHVNIDLKQKLESGVAVKVIGHLVAAELATIHCLGNDLEGGDRIAELSTALVRCLANTLANVAHGDKERAGLALTVTVATLQAYMPEACAIAKLLGDVAGGACSHEEADAMKQAQKATLN